MVLSHLFEKNENNSFQLQSCYGFGCSIEGLVTHSMPHLSFHKPVVLLNDVIKILALANLNACIVAEGRPRLIISFDSCFVRAEQFINED